MAQSLDIHRELCPGPPGKPNPWMLSLLGWCRACKEPIYFLMCTFDVSGLLTTPDTMSMLCVWVFFCNIEEIMTRQKVCPMWVLFLFQLEVVCVCRQGTYGEEGPSSFRGGILEKQFSWELS